MASTLAGATKQEEDLRAPQLAAYEEEKRVGSESEGLPPQGSLQRWLLQTMQTQRYECFLGGVVFFNVILLIVETDAAATCPSDRLTCSPGWLIAFGYILLAIYTVDVSCAIFAQRSSFFCVLMNWIDLTVVLLGYFEICVFLATQGNGNSLLSMVRMLRIARMTRVAKLVRPLPELFRLVTGFIFTLRAIFWGFVMLVLLLLVWAIIFLQILSALDAKDAYQDPRFAGYWCEESMQSTANMAILLWQSLITGDSWGACTLPVILKHPAMYWVYASAFVCINIGFTNLILAVIVENAQSQHEEEVVRRLLQRKQDLERDIENFRDTFRSLDGDNSGTLSLHEFIEGFDDMEDFKRGLQKFGIDKGDLTHVFRCVDLDSSGGVSYMEFVDAMFKSQRQDADTQMMMIQLGVKKLLSSVEILLQKLSCQFPNASAGPASNDQHVSSEDVAVDISLEGAKAHPLAKAYVAIPEVPSMEKDLACLKQLQLESLELRLQEVSAALQQHSSSLSQEAHELRTTLTQMEGGTLNVNIAEKLSTCDGHISHTDELLSSPTPPSFGSNHIVLPSLEISCQDDIAAVGEDIRTIDADRQSKAVCCSLVG